MKGNRFSSCESVLKCRIDDIGDIKNDWKSCGNTLCLSPYNIIMHCNNFNSDIWEVKQNLLHTVPAADTTH